MPLDAMTLLTELDYLKDETRNLPWRWDVKPRAHDDVIAFDVRPAEDEDTPTWLPYFTIKRLALGYEISAFLHADDLDDYPQPPDATLEAAFAFIPCFLAGLLEEWGLQRLARDLPEEV